MKTEEDITTKESHPGIQSRVDLRDYFAGRAIIGLLSADNHMTKDCARLAYKVADDMLAARNGGAS